MKLVKKFKVTISPPNQKALLLQSELCRELWNLALEQRICTWKSLRKSINVYAQKKELSELKDEFEDFRSVYNKYLSAVIFRLDRAFKAFFSRIKTGATPGFPRFKGKGEFFSLETPGMYCRAINEHKIMLPQGIVATTKDILPETIRTVTIKKSGGSWFISIITDVDTRPPPEYKKCNILAFDLGIKTLAVGFNGSEFKVFNTAKLRYLDKTVDAIKSKKSKCKRGSRRYRRYGAAIKTMCQKITNKRRNHFHCVTKQISAREVENTIVVGDLHVKGMVTNNKRKNRETQNRWAVGEFISMLKYKCELYGKRFATISEHNTTKMCSGCHGIQNMSLDDRVYDCPKCGLKLDRDQNSAINIYERAMAKLKDLITSCRASATDLCVAQ